MRHFPPASSSAASDQPSAIQPVDAAYPQAPAAYPPYAPPQPSVMFVAPPPVVIVNQQRQGPGCLVRGIWFVGIGWWLGMLITGIGWALCASILGLPLGLLLFSRLPQAMTLQTTQLHTQVQYTASGQVVIQQGRAQQLPFWLRAVYFCLVGWWLSAGWLGAAWMLGSLSFGLLLPVSFWMFNQVPAVITLQRN